MDHSRMTQRIFAVDFPGDLLIARPPRGCPGRIGMLKKGMAKGRKIVLRVLAGNESRLEPFVEQCLRDGVKLIAVMGDNCARIEDIYRRTDHR